MYGPVPHIRQPNVILTTSRKSSPRVRHLLNYLEEILPLTLKFNRGKSSFQYILHTTKALGANYLFYVTSKNGNPDYIYFIDIKDYSVVKIPILGVSLPVDKQVVKRRLKAPCIERSDDIQITRILIEMGASIGICKPTIDIRTVDGSLIISFSYREDNFLWIKINSYTFEKVNEFINYDKWIRKGEIAGNDESHI
ncbi:hypothetical protein HS7_08030 [Sulfolobales archaeon HS-7]|nr:hypothetical protein HS7_08030 [Sulfolobales archaeon HS-7]